MDDPYAELAERYDLFHGGVAEHDAGEAAFFAWLVGTYGVQRALDCACGTGRHLHLMATLGCEVTGSDRSAAMLARARHNLEDLGMAAGLHLVDFRELPRHFGPEYDAVLCLSSSFLHMPDDEQALAALASMRAVLRPGGIVVLTQGTSDYQWRQKPRFILAVDNEAVTRIFVIDYLGQGARYNIVDVIHGQTDSLQVWGTEYRKVFLQEDYQMLLRQAGFSAMTCYGSWDRKPYAKDRPGRLIVVGQTSQASHSFMSPNL